jgi:hypothetical protein
MFDELDKKIADNGADIRKSGDNALEDIFNKFDSGTTEDVLAIAGNINKEKPEIFLPKGDSVKSSQFVDGNNTKSDKKKLIFAIIVLALIAILLGAGFFIVQWFVFDKRSEQDITNKIPERQNQVSDEEKNQTDQQQIKIESNKAEFEHDGNKDIVEENQSQEIFEKNGIIPGENLEKASEVSAEEIMDSDNDGLTDSEENQEKTDVLDEDTDKDGLLDGQEIKNYHTDPLSADTDGDGYFDEAEILGGYNPNGPGKFESAQGISSTTADF